MELDKKKVYLIVFLVIVGLVLVVINYTTNCSYDESCFNKYAEKCSRAKVNLIKDSGDQFYYEIQGSKADSCVMIIYLMKSNDQTPPEVKKFMQGKGMICEVPKTELSKPISEIKNINDYCTGPLKEALLQITVENLYSLVVKNLGPEAMQGYATTQ